MESINTKPKKLDWGKWASYAAVCFVIYCGIQFFTVVNKPHSYEECVMDAIKPGDSDTAAKIKAAVCSNKFGPKNAFEVVELEVTSAKTTRF